MHPVLFRIGPVFIPAYGAFAALGVLLALALLLRTARRAGLSPNLLWNLAILSLFAALAGSRLLLIAVNWTIVRTHPSWLLGLAMIHHPLLAAIGAVIAFAAALPYARRMHLPFRPTADALSAPLALAFAFEQAGALAAGAGYGRETTVPWAVIYTHPLAARWSGAPLFVPVHPAQAYAALAWLLIAVALVFAMRFRHQSGDIAGAFLIAAGVAIYFTEFFRDPEGRGSLLGGVLDAPQLAAVAAVLAGALLLRERRRRPALASAEAPHA